MFSQVVNFRVRPLALAPLTKGFLAVSWAPKPGVSACRNSKSPGRHWPTMEFGAAREHTSPLNLHPAPDTIAAMSSQYSAVEVILPREVPLGGPRAMTVHRTIPHRQRPMIGAWCFVDHYGPDDVAVTGGMDVAPRAFEHFVPEEGEIAGARVKVFLGELGGWRSGVDTRTPPLGAQLHIAPGAEVELAVEAPFEHGLLVDAAGIRLENVELPVHAIGYMGVGETAMHIENTSDEWVYALLIGSEPFRPGLRGVQANAGLGC